MNLDGKVALVTGAAGDIGRAIAKALAEAGAAVVVHDLDRDERLSATVAAVEAAGRRSLDVTGDIRDPGAVRSFIDTAVASFGQLNVLVNNAGVMTETPLRRLGIEEWQRVIDVNLTGCFLCTRFAAEPMIRAGGGAIVNIASQLAYRGGIGLAHYSAAKAGVIGFTRAAARELGEHGIRVNAVAPGPVDTQMIAPYKTPEWLSGKLSGSILKRLARPEEIAATVVFLASDAASLYFGQTLSPNGGGVMP
jgi:3-oxoacyl-[acyl-carrier protein] reductase